MGGEIFRCANTDRKLGVTWKLDLNILYFIACLTLSYSVSTHYATLISTKENSNVGMYVCKMDHNYLTAAPTSRIRTVNGLGNSEA